MEKVKILLKFLGLRNMKSVIDDIVENRDKKILLDLQKTEENILINI